MESFPSAEAAADAAADAIATQLKRPGIRHLLVTGGSGPGPVYDRLAKMDLDWPRVIVRLSDERFVDPDHELSNERLVRERLLQAFAEWAPLVPLRRSEPASLEVEAASAEAPI